MRLPDGLDAIRMYTERTLSFLIVWGSLFVCISSPTSADGYDKFRTPCTPDQTLMVKATIAEAKSILTKTIQVLPPRNSTIGNKFRRWFGGREGESDDTLQKIYSEILSFIDAKIFWCANRTNVGREDTVAFVRKGSFFEIFIMGSFFFDAPNSGADSKAGTLIHEASHQATVARIVDSDVTGDGKPDYGISNAEQLARTRPDRARRTGDNLEYFAEDIAYGI